MADPVRPSAAPRRPRLLGRGLAWDLGLVALGIGLFFAFPYDLAFLTRVMIMIVFVLSLDLILGYAGVATLGHAAMYGTGAYAAGLFAKFVTGDPVLGLIAGALAGAVIAFVSGLVLMRARGLTLLMLSIAAAEVLREIANKARGLTGGADGLRGIRMEPLFGIWEFDFIGRTGYWYVLCVLVLVLLGLKVVVNSPFGLSARGIHESPERMRAIGTSVYWRLVTIYTLAGAVAGIAGALAAQVTQLVSLEVYGFDHSAEAVIMLVLGGAGRLYGAVAGAGIFMTVEHMAAAVDPFNWLFLIGALVLAVVYFVPAGLLGLPRAFRDLLGGRK